MAIRNDDHTQRVERIEHVEHIHDDPRLPASANVNVGSGGAANQPVWTATRVVTLVFSVLEVLLLLRFTFKLARANANQPLVASLYGVTEPLTKPFQGIFPEPPGVVIVDVPALLAIVFLFLIAALIVALVRAVTSPRAY